ncbi:unannotated protein [freshwater metagenome]|uniref:Unannotated protein n=1 Tax=freshwater metagenome TaxID=449393 RepID=A0A6J6G5M9_9ZZZZ
MIVLAMKIDQTRADLGKFSDRRQASIDVCPRSALCRHDSADNAFPITEIETTLDNSFIGTGPNHRRFGLPPNQQLDGSDDQRLSGTSLASDCGHPGRENKRKLFNHTEIANPQFTQH